MRRASPGAAVGRRVAQRVGHAELARHAGARRAAHGLRAHLGEPAGAVALEAREQMGGDREAQDDVTEEGEPLVGLGALLDPRRVRERLPPERVGQLVEKIARGSHASAAWAATKSAAWPTVRILTASSSGIRIP